MKCTYYSCYLMGRDRKEKRVKAEDYKCKWSGDAMLTEFRTAYAPRCYMESFEDFIKFYTTAADEKIEGRLIMVDDTPEPID